MPQPRLSDLWSAWLRPRTIMSRRPQASQVNRLVVNAFRIRENSSGRVKANRNQEMTGRRAVESTPPPEPEIRSEMRMAQKWIVTAKRLHIAQPIW